MEINMSFGKAHLTYTDDELAVLSEEQEIAARLNKRGVEVKDIRPANGGGYVITIPDWDRHGLYTTHGIKVIDTRAIYNRQTATGIIVAVIKLAGV
jgi:hypothetical protein